MTAVNVDALGGELEQSFWVNVLPHEHWLQVVKNVYQGLMMGISSSDVGIKLKKERFYVLEDSGLH